MGSTKELAPPREEGDLNWMTYSIFILSHTILLKLAIGSCFQFTKQDKVDLFKSLSDVNRYNSIDSVNYRELFQPCSKLSAHSANIFKFEIAQLIFLIFLNWFDILSLIHYLERFLQRLVNTQSLSVLAYPDEYNSWSPVQISGD